MGQLLQAQLAPHQGARQDYERGPGDQRHHRRAPQLRRHRPLLDQIAARRRTTSGTPTAPGQAWFKPRHRNEICPPSEAPPKLKSESEGPAPATSRKKLQPPLAKKLDKLPKEPSPTSSPPQLALEATSRPPPTTGSTSSSSTATASRPANPAPSPAPHPQGPRLDPPHARHRQSRRRSSRRLLHARRRSRRPRPRRQLQLRRPAGLLPGDAESTPSPTSSSTSSTSTATTPATSPPRTQRPPRPTLLRRPDRARPTLHSAPLRRHRRRRRGHLPQRLRAARRRHHLQARRRPLPQHPLRRLAQVQVPPRAGARHRRLHPLHRRPRPHRRAPARLLRKARPKKLIYAGRTGTGFTQKLAATSSPNSSSSRPTPLRAHPPDARRGALWVKPTLVAQVRFATWTADNLVRQAAFLGLREDKPATEVTREEPPSPPTQIAPPVPPGGPATAPLQKAALKAPKSAPPHLQATPHPPDPPGQGPRPPNPASPSASSPTTTPPSPPTCCRTSPAAH
jgi:hypothetical protein